MIHAGTYREWVCPSHDGREGLPITICAALGERPILKASDLWKPEWIPDEGDVWSTVAERLPWATHPMATANCEQVFVDNVLLPFVDDRDRLEGVDRGMTVEDLDEERVTVHIKLPAGRSPTEASIERSVRQQCLSPLVRGLGHLHVRGLTMVGGATSRWHGPNWNHIGMRSVISVNGGYHWVIEDNDIGWGNSQGVQIAGGGFSMDQRRTPRAWPPPEFQDDGDLTWHPALDRAEQDTMSEALMRRNVLRRNHIHDHGIAGVVGIGLATGLVIEHNTVTGCCRVDQNRGTAEEAAI